MARVPLFATFVLVACLTYGTRSGSAQPPAGSSETSKPAKPIGDRSVRPAANDSLGDPLPEAARLRLGTLRFRPPSSVVELALSPNGKTIVSVGRELIAWDALSGKELWRADPRESGSEVRAAAYGVRALAFSPDGARLYAPGRPNEVVIWDPVRGTHEILPVKSSNKNRGPIEQAARAIDVAPDGQKLALGRASGVVVSDLQGNVKYEIANAPEGPSDFDQNDRLTFAGHYSLAQFSPDGKLLAVVTSDHPDHIRLCDANSGRHLRTLELASRLVRMAFSPDSKALATTERDSAVRLYDTESGNRSWSHVVKLTDISENYTSAIAFSPDGMTVAVCATDNCIYLLNAKTGEEIARLAGHRWYPWALAFSSNSMMLYSSGWDGFIRRWDVAARKQLALPSGVWAAGVLAASPDARTLAYEFDSGEIRLVDIESGKERAVLALPDALYSQLMFSPDGRQLAGGGACEKQVHVALWDVASGNLLHRWDWPTGRDPHSSVEALCFTPDGRRLAAAVFRQSAAYVWDLKTSQQISRLAHRQIYGIAFNRDGQSMVTVGWDSIIRFWDLNTGQAGREVNVAEHDKTGDLRMYAVRSAPDGEILATAHLDGTIRIWNTEPLHLQTHFQVAGRLVYGAMAFSPDGLWLATGSMDGTVNVWEPFAGKSVWNVGCHQSYVKMVGFGRDARSLASGGSDGLCYLWDLRPPNSRTDQNLAGLWHDLVGEDGQPAYEAMFALSGMPDRAAAMLAENLGLVKTVVDLDRIAEGSTGEEAQRRRRLTKLLVERDPKVKLAIGVKRAVSLLDRLRTPAAIDSLTKLAGDGPNLDVRRFAAAALERSRAAAKP